MASKTSFKSTFGSTVQIVSRTFFIFAGFMAFFLTASKSERFAAFPKSDGAYSGVAHADVAPSSYSEASYTPDTSCASSDAGSAVGDGGSAGSAGSGCSSDAGE